MPIELQERNKAIVQQWIDEVFNGGELASVDKLKVSSYLDWTPLPAPYQDVELPVSGIKAALPEWLESLPDFEFTSDQLMADGDFVVCLGHWSAHHRGDYKGHEATHRRVGGTRIDIFRVAGDKMVEHWGCGNELAFMQLVGALDADERPAVGIESPAQVAQTYVESVLDRRDLAAVAALVDPEAVDHGGQAVSMLALVAAFPDLAVTVVDVTVDGDEALVTSEITGTHRGRFLGVEATGRRVHSTRVDRFRLTDGRIVESWRESDDGDLLDQLTA